MERIGRTAAHAVFATGDLLVARKGGPRILIYHQVGSGRPHEMNVPVEVFRRQIEWLHAHYRIVSLEEAVSRRGEEDSNRLAVLTFDDGYADMYRNAFPILEKRGFPFTLYITSGPIENPGAFPAWPGEPLSWANAREMAATGLMTVGAHTHTHPDLRMVDEPTARFEIEESNRLIEERLGVAPRHFTYTKGWWSAAADPAVRRSYDTATLGMGPSITADSDRYLLSRLTINQSEPHWAWRRKLTTGGPSEDFVRRRLHGYRGP